MLEFLRAGGLPSLVILVLGLSTFALAGVFARRPDPRQLEVLKTLAVAVVLSVVAGTAAACRAVLTRVPAELATAPDLHLVVMQGFGEALAPSVLGFGLLSAAWILVAVGLRRLAHRM